MGGAEGGVHGDVADVAAGHAEARQLGVVEPFERRGGREAAVPGIIALLVLVSQRSKYPLVKKILLNDELMDLAKLDASLKAHNAEQLFASKLQNCAYLVAGSFVVSSVLNYGLAKYLLVSAPGTPAFNEELAKMTALSFPVIALPCTVMLMVAIWYLFSRIGKVTGESIESFLRQ